MLAFPAVVAGVLVATVVIDAGDGGSLGALQGWTLAAALAIGYVLSRGFAKSGIRAHRGSPGRSRERTARRAGRGRS